MSVLDKIFKNYDSLESKILDKMTTHWVSTTGVHRLLSNNEIAEDIHEALRLLLGAGKIEMEEVIHTGGAPMTIFRLRT